VKKVLFAIALLVTMAAAGLAQVPAAPQPPALVVSGNGEILANPDEASVRLGIVRQAPAAQAAQDQVTGANQLEGVQFGLRNALPSRQSALKQAVTEARSKAETMAQALGVTLVEVLEVSEGGSITPNFDVAQAGRLFEASAVAPTPVSPGQIQVYASVTIRYRISQKP
jgi:uncharacterized protein YggE